MKDFVEFLKTHKIISTLKNHYRKNSNSIEIGEFIDNFDFKQLLSVKSYDNKNRAYNLDEFAAIYEQNISYAERKKLGEIYSPQFIVDKILDETGFYDTNCDGNKSIIDISCGAGSFLVQAVRRVACILCQINILYTLFFIIKQILMMDSEFQIPIFHIYNRNIFSTKVDHKYDYVIGNPPYLFIREISEEQKLIIEKGEFETAQGQYDYYQLFIEIGIKMLNSDGILGFIIPDSILALSNRHIIRKYIYDHTLIKEILYLGPQFEDPVVSNLIIILQEERDPRKREKNIIGIKINWNSDVISNSILQSYIKGWNYKFLISLNQEDIKILNFLNKNIPKLNHIMESSNYDIYITRGVELTKEGKVIYCRECNKYYPLPRGKLVCKICNNNLLPQSIETIIVDQKPQNQNLSYAPFIYSINRYNTKQFKYIILGKPGIDYKSPGIYKDRVIIFIRINKLGINFILFY
ncbi:MAG: N-6 DNA methylase [Candidatus Lokiarchaeota archaeon]